MITEPKIDVHSLLVQKHQPAGLRPGQILELLGDLERLKAELWLRLLEATRREGEVNPSAQEDRLLTVKEASLKLNVSADWLYRRASKLPFAVRLGHRRLRFSERAIDRYIRRRMGRCE